MTPKMHLWSRTGTGTGSRARPSVSISLHAPLLPLPLLEVLWELLLWQVSQCDSSSSGQPPQLPKCQPISRQAQSPLLQVHYFPPSLLLQLRGESVIKVPLWFLWGVGERLVGTRCVGQVWLHPHTDLPSAPSRAEKAQPATGKGRKRDKKGVERRGGRQPHSEFQHSPF